MGIPGHPLLRLWSDATRMPPVISDKDQVRKELNVGTVTVLTELKADMTHRTKP